MLWLLMFLPPSNSVLQTYIPERVYMRVVAVHSCARVEEWSGPPSCHPSEQWYLRYPLPSPRCISKNLGKPKVFILLSIRFCISPLLLRGVPVTGPKCNCSKLCHCPTLRTQNFSQVSKEHGNNRLVTAGRSGAAKAILVIMSLCLCVRWHGSQTFTAGEVDVFRKETELLVVSQAACLVPWDIFLVCEWLSNSSSGGCQGLYGVKAQKWWQICLFIAMLSFL